MFTSAEKANRTSTTVQQKAQQQTFFRKAGEESFFGGKEQPSLFNAPIQAKLSISSPDDPQEKEADAVADKVMRTPAPVSDTISNDNEKKIDKKEDEEVQVKSQVPSISKAQTASLNDIGHLNTQATMHRSAEEPSEALNEADNNNATAYISRKATGLYRSDTIQRSGRGPPTGSIPFAQSLSSSKGAGSALPGKTRQFMESRFNADFSGVRIHTGPQANAMNKSIQSKAFAHGNDIYFKQGEHNPESPEGAKLLAHELTHTIQQGASTQTEKNGNTRVNPVQPTNQPANDKSALLPATPSANKANQPGTPQNGSSNPAESGSPLTEELSNHDQLAEHSLTAAESVAPVDTGTPAVAGSNNQPTGSSSPNHPAQTRQAHRTQTGRRRKSVGDTQQAGGSGERQANAGNVALINDRINGARASAVKTSVVIQAAVINQDYFNTETRLDNISTIRKEQVRNIFVEAHANLDAFFVRSMATLTAAILAAQMTVMAQVNATLGNVQAFISGMAALAYALVINTIAFVSTLVANTLAAIAKAINMVGSRVTNLINSVNLPNLPGAATIRDYIRNSIYSVSRLIMVALRAVQALIASALVMSLRFLTGLIQTITRAVSNVISNITLIINRIINTIATAFQGILRVATITLQNLLHNSIHPMLVNIEAMILGTIDTLHEKALQDATENREQALEALAGMMGAQSGATAPGSGRPMTMAETLAAVTAISKQATERNKEIADRFDEDTGILVSILRQRSMVFIALVLAAIIGAMGAIMIKVMELIASINQAIAALAVRIIAGFIGFVGSIIRSLSTFITLIGTFISHPLHTAIAFGESVFNLIISFVANLVRRFISGLLGVNSQQAPTVQPHAVAAGVPVPATVITSGTLVGDIRRAIIAAFVTIGMAIIWSFAAVITYLVETVVLAITIGMAALLRIFLMWRFITAPRPRPYPKPSPNLTITHETIFAAPNGSAKTRKKVGVGEEVKFTSNAVGDWTASGGTPLVLAGNNKFRWTAPERGNTITVTFSDGIKTVSEVMEVIEPMNVTGTRDSVLSFRSGRHGVGMKLRLHYHPDGVSFGNVDVKEVSGPASNISGYFLTHAPPFHNSGDSFLPVKENNDDSVLDTASLFGFRSPWSLGAFDWSIPYHFKVRSEAGEKKFTDVIQAFKMFDATGKTEITKGGAQVDRTP